VLRLFGQLLLKLRDGVVHLALLDLRKLVGDFALPLS